MRLRACTGVRVCAPIFLLQIKKKKKESETELVFQGWKFKWNWKVSGLDCLPVPNHSYKTGTENKITPFSLSRERAHTQSRAQVQSKETVKDGLPNVLILCLLSFIAHEMNVSLPCLSPPGRSSLSLVFWPTGHIYYPLMNDTENRICAYCSRCTVSAIHPAPETSEPYDLFQ